MSAEIWQQATALNLPPWIPHQPHEQQHLALIAPRFAGVDPVEIFYGGAAGGGKSDWLLMAALQYADVPGYAALLLRRTMTELSLPGALLPRSKQWLSDTSAVWNEGRKEWSFPSGATLTFSFLELEDDVYRYQSAEFQFIGFDELTKFPESQYTYLFSRLRKPAEGPLSKVPLRLAAASNPGGIGHAWVKNRFVQPARLPQGRIFVPAKLADNPSLQRETYTRSLTHLSETLREQLLEGDWGAFEGAAYPAWDEAIHTVDPFQPPGTWERFEQMDFGSTNPTAWFVTAVDYDGNLIVLDGYYRPGLPSEHAPEILRRRKDSWLAKDEYERPIANTVYADPAVWADTGVTNRWGRPATVADEFADCGIPLVKAINDRRAGFVRLSELVKRDELHPFPAWHERAGAMGAPRLFIMRREGNRELIEQMGLALVEGPKEPYPGEAVSRAWEGPYGHAHAALRYGAMSRPDASVAPVPEDVLERTGAYLDRLDKRESLRSEFTQV